MRSFLQIAVVALCAVQTAAIFGFEKAPTVTSNVASVFGVSRGGGLFGGKDAGSVAEKE